MTKTSADEIGSGERFPFGRNWQRFLATVDEGRIAEAERSLIEMLGRENLDSLRFLDIGCGSGLFSLAAHRLGATVHSFDFDPASVACTRELQRRWGRGDADWLIEEGSALDEAFVSGLGSFDVVYSWGVLHHTGDMWSAFDQARRPVADDGQLFIAIYNDQGRVSRAWWHVKRLYCSGGIGRAVVLALFVPVLACQAALVGVIRHRDPRWQFRNYRSKRGMSITHDWIDWLGGFPYEYASVESITSLYESLGFVVERTVPTRRWGCNQFVFRHVQRSPGKGSDTPP